MKNSIILFPDYHNLWIMARNVVEDVAFKGDASRVSVSGSASAVVFHPPSDLYSVPVNIGTFENAPPLDLEDKQWNHIVEASIEVTEGHLTLGNGFPENELKVDLPNGMYRVRIYFGGLVEDGIDRDEGSDHYDIAIWRQSGPPKGLQVLKQWSEFLAVVGSG